MLRAADTKRAEGPNPSDKVWPPPSLDTWVLEAEASPDTEWILDRLLPRDAIVLVSGVAKLARKSLLTMLLTRAVLESKPELLGPSWRPSVASSPGPRGEGLSEASAVVATHPTMESAPQPGKLEPRALIVAYEGPVKATANLWRRLSGTKPGSPTPAWMKRVRWAHRYTHIKLNDAAWVAELCAYVKEEKFSIVIIDTFRRALVGNERDDENVSKAIDALEAIRTATNGGCVIFVHHIRKPPPKNPGAESKNQSTEEEDFDAEVRGSSAIPGAYDHHLAVRTSFDRKALWLYTRSKIDEDRFFRVDWTIEDGAASCDVSEWTTPLDSEQLAELYEAAPRAGKLRDFAKRWNLPFSVSEEAIDQLEVAGMLREDHGRYVKEE